MPERTHNTEISGEDRAILAIAGFVRFISLLDVVPIRLQRPGNV
jgi:hypothetical protein